MNLQQQKTAYLKNKSQFVIFDQNGNCLDSCDTLFPFSGQKESLFKKIYFLESTKDTIMDFQPGDEMEFPCIEFNHEGKSGYYDFTLALRKINGKEVFLWIILDFTNHYRSLINIQQERNESAIREEFMGIKQKAIQLEKKLLEFQNEELKRIQNFKTDFFSKVSHEMRTPLNGIMGLSNLILQSDSGVKQTEYLRALMSTANHLGAIVNDVLDLSKIESGKMQFEKVDFDLRDIVKSVINSFSFSCKEKGIALTYFIDESIPNVLIGDQVKLSQILYNLIGNAIKFTSKGGVDLSIHCEKLLNDQAELSIIVQDTGIGISQENLKRIFQPYVQADAKTERLYGGTGLGLSIVKQLIEMQGGTLNIRSQEGQGTSISFNMDLGIGNASNSAQTKHSAKTPIPAEFSTVLVAEDDIINQKVLHEFLISWGMKPEIVSNGQAALEKLKKSNYDLLILDFHMPVLDGLSTLKKVRSIYYRERSHFIPVIMLSGDTKEQLERAVKKIPDTYLMSKPINPDTLLSQIQQIAAHKEKMLGQDQVNIVHLKKICNNSDDLLKDIIQTFLDNVPEVAFELRSLHENADYAILKSRVHRVKPSFSYVGMQPLTEAIDKLESWLQKGNNKDKYLSIIERIERATHQAVIDLETEKANLES